MFEIDENDLPVVRTRQAFLALDLQADFLTFGGSLHVTDPPNFLENITNVASHFRQSGNVIWIRTVYEASRAVNATHGESEKVITDRELLPSRRSDGTLGGIKLRPSHKLLERYGMMAATRGGKTEDDTALEVDEEEETDPTNEAYLTVEPGKTPTIAINASTGANFTQDVGRAIDVERDLVFQKSHYSAFKDGRLVQILRANFVTEIYICGALTNISVFATAMDAARHGYAITILDDCLGYRSKARHDEALRQLSEFTGCDIISSSELIANLKRKANVKKAPPRRHMRPGQKDSSLEKLMSNLNIKPASHSSQPPAQSSKNVAVEPAGGSSESQVPNIEPHKEPSVPPLPVEGEKKKPERVKTKIKARRRHPDTSQKDPVSETLHAASQALENLPTVAQAEEELSHSPDIIEPEPSTNESMEPEDKQKEENHDLSKSEAFLNIKINAPTDVTTEGPTPLCEGDTIVIENVLSDELAEGIFERIRDEIRWQKMSHQGGDVPRLVAVQGEVAEDGSVPIYRHPADESPPMLPFSPTVSLVRAEIEKKLGHAVNHVLIQFYRDGTDYISEHSDKTLDIVPKTFIANVSLGAQRTMVFRTKKAEKNGAVVEEPVQPRKACRAPLPHNSMCSMGLDTNMRWLHAIRQDKRLLSEKSEAELAYDGGRISLTFRLIGTFLDKDQQKIWGQGATSKNKEEPKTVINGNGEEAEKMIRAFGQENHSSEFDWDEHYGKGFDVLHISNSPKLFLSRDVIANLRVKILLAEYNISWTEGKLSPSFNWKNGSSRAEAPPIPECFPVKFVDNDLSKSAVTGDLAILLYLNAVYGPKSQAEGKSQVDNARQFTRFYQADELLKKWRAVPFSVKPLRRELQLWDAYAQEASFIAGSTISLADYAVFPIFEDMAAEWGPGACEFDNLEAYFVRMKTLESVKKALGDEGEANGHSTEAKKEST